MSVIGSFIRSRQFICVASNRIFTTFTGLRLIYLQIGCRQPCARKLIGVVSIRSGTEVKQIELYSLSAYGKKNEAHSIMN
jgi:hypothetical protein